MWKAISLALGIALIIVGTQLFFVDELEVRRIGNPTDTSAVMPNAPYQNASWGSPLMESESRTFLYRPHDWIPWSLLAVGSVIVIYTFTLTSRRE